MSESIMECHGVGHLVTLFSNKIEISGKKGVMGMLTAGGSSQSIRIKNITGVEYKKGGFTNGYIQFRTASSANTTKGGMFSVLETADDPNTVHFPKKENDAFMALKDKVEDLMDGYDAGQNAGSTAAPSAADELKKYGDLLKDGLITQEDFDKKKKELLGL